MYICIYLCVNPTASSSTDHFPDSLNSLGRIKVSGMQCLVLPLSMLRRRPRLGYRPLTEEDAFGESGDPVKVVVGKEKREFVVDPFVLEENPFQILIDILKKDKKARVDIDNAKRVIFVDVDSILFEHMLWLMMNNDCSSLLQLNLKEIVDFYTQDN